MSKPVIPGASKTIVKKHSKVQVQSRIDQFLPCAKSSKQTAPEKWEQVYELIEQQRKQTPAPVDTLGCSHLHDTTASEPVQRFQILVALMLSSQTKDLV
jgi:hypothetical protein